MKLLLVLIIIISTIYNQIQCIKSESIKFNSNSDSGGNLNYYEWSNKDNWISNELIPNENDTIIIDSVPKPIISNQLDTIINGYLEIKSSSLTINSNQNIKSQKILSNIFMDSNSYLIINLDNNDDNNNDDNNNNIYTLNNITCNNNSNNHIIVNNDNKIIIKDSQISNIKITTKNVLLSGYNIISNLEWDGDGIFSFNNSDNYLVLVGNDKMNKNQFSFNGEFIIRNRIRIVNSTLNVNNQIKINEWSNVEIQDSIINSNIYISNGSGILSFVGDNQLNGELNINGTNIISSTPPLSSSSTSSVIYENGHPQLYLGPAFKSLHSKKAIKIKSSDIYISKELDSTHPLIESEGVVSISNTIINIDLASDPKYNHKYILFTGKQIKMDSYEIGSISIDGTPLDSDSFKIDVINNIYNNSTKNNKSHSLTIIYFNNINNNSHNNNSNNNNQNNNNNNNQNNHNNNHNNHNNNSNHNSIEMPSNSSSNYSNHLFFIISIIIILII